jgi:phospholipid N-methyltransferase
MGSADPPAGPENMALDFVRRLRNPALIGAVAPSSRALAELIVSRIDPARGPVLELGAGTGVFTEALLAMGIAPGELTLVEADQVFAQMLKRRFPAVEVVHARAEEALNALGPLGCRLYADAVSGLPLLNMPVPVRRRILAGVFNALVMDGALYQFTYGPQPPVDRASLAALGLGVERMGRVWRNLPPATVYRIRRSR